MGIKDRIRRLEQHTPVFVCPECGEAVRDVGDLPLKVLAASWQEEVGVEREPDPAVDKVLNHPHEGLQDAVFEDFPGIVRA